MDSEALLSPVAPDAPAGPDLSYDPGRQAIEQAFAAEAEDADWDRTIAMIEAQARLTRDIWLAIYLARAGARAGDLTTVEAGMALLAGLFERFWDSAHPTLEDYGIEGRKGACESLVRIGEFLGPLRRVPLIEHSRLGQYSGGDFERYAVEGANAIGYGQFRAAVADTPIESLAETIDRLGRIRDAVTQVDTILSEQAGRHGQTGTNFRPTYDTLDAMVRALKPFVTQSTNGMDEQAEPPMGVAASTPAATPGRVNSREEAARAIDAVIEYFGRAEPSSPVPVALSRIKGWITMDFVAILNDIAPNSLGDVTNVLHTRRDGSDSSNLM